MTDAELLRSVLAKIDVLHRKADSQKYYEVISSGLFSFLGDWLLTSHLRAKHANRPLRELPRSSSECEER